MPGNHGGVNWGMTAGEPKSGRFYVSSFDLPTMLRLAKMSAQPVGQFATPKDRGRALFAINCAICHGDDMQGIPPVPVLKNVVAKLGSDGTFNTIRAGRSTMPAFAGTLTDADISALVAFLADPTPSPATLPPGGAATAAETHGSSGPDLNAPGEERYYTSYGFMVSAKSFLPVISPPWTTITAYDLNQGKLLWQVPLGGVPGYPVAQTGVSRSKGGLAVTEGGLIFASSSDDRKLHAYDRDTGKLLWEAVLPSIPQGTPAIYQVNGREYVAVAATYWPKGGGMTPVGPARGEPGKNAYVVFALPRR